METTDIKAEMKRRKSKREDLLKSFERFGELSTSEIVQIAGTGMSSRIKELKKKGHVISARPTKQPGIWAYQYLGQRDAE